ncbi:MAG TPA: hypothetical protein DEP19_03750, partial [Anaerolineae bacterium]|nr:hypothetical protein [Anaerolineae bacterium]
VQGDNNVINLPPEYVKINSLYQLPQALADFTGREDLLKEILSDFETSKGTTISGLTGLGGIGKTALGLQVAHQIKDKYPDAQIFIDLKGTTAPLTALDIARHVILAFEPSADLRGLDENNMQAVFQSILNGKRALLYFDNARSAEQIAKLIPPQPCALIVTSRWTFPVAGLKTHKVGVLDEKEAVQFLLELCPRIPDHANELAKACGYLPLALRIAGSYLGVNHNIGVDTYLAELASVKSRLETFAKSREDAELTSEPDVFATFELSYNHLNQEQQKMWRTLGVFPAPFDSIAVAAMWEIEDVKNAEEVLSLLMRYSLIDFNEASARYELHDLLGEFARSKMKGGEEEEAYIQHAKHYMQVMETADELYLQGGENILLGLRLFDVEWENIRSAHAWITTNVNASESIAELGMYFPDAATYCLDLRLPPRDKILWLEIAKDAAKKLGRRDMEGVHLGNLGLAYYSLGEVKKAIEYHEQALVIAREIGDRRNEGNWLGNFGSALYGSGEKEKGIESVKQALAIFEAIESPSAELARNKLKEWGV